MNSKLVWFCLGMHRLQWLPDGFTEPHVSSPRYNPNDDEKLYAASVGNISRLKKATPKAA